MDVGAFLAAVGPIAGLALGLVTAIVEGVKRVFPAMPTRFCPAIAVVVGEALGVALGLELGLRWDLGAFAGLMAGLGSAGLYSLGKSAEQAIQPRS